MWFRRRRAPESLFSNRQRPRRISLRSVLRPAFVLALALLVGWALRPTAAFYSALWDARRAIDRHEYPRAQEALERAWQIRPGHPWIHDGIGFLFLMRAETGWRNDARASYAKAMEAGLKRNLFIDHVAQAGHLIDQGHYDLAEVETEHALELNPRGARANLLAGHLALAEGKVAKAVDLYLAAQQLDPGSEVVKAALVHAQEAKSRGSVPYLVDRNGQVLAAEDLASGHPVYPGDFWTAHLTGYRSADHGSAGLEAALGDHLHGNQVTLTIDARLQRIADSALGWQKGAVVILKPQTGEILAAVSHPTFRPSLIDATWRKIMENPNAPLKNRAFEGLYEPGSIAKIITTAAILESRVDTSKLFPFRCRGHMMIGNEIFWDWTAHKNMNTLLDAFDNSCNVGMARIAPHLGAAALTGFMRSFGFAENDRIPLEIPVAPSHAPLDPANPYALASACIGLGSDYRITPLHAAMMIASIANGGVMMAPTLVKEVRSVTGRVISTASPKVYKIAMKKETAAQLTTYLVDFVEHGIGKRARILRIKVAGKTGTSGNSKKGLNGWFLCFAPADKPEIAVAVFCENGGTGHGIAAPVAQHLLVEALR